MKLNIYIFVLLSMIILACNDSNTLQDDLSSVESSASNSTHSVKESGFDLQISLSKQEETPELKFRFEPSFGHVEFFIDENFDFTITQDEIELEDLKTELEQDGLFSYKFYAYSDNELVYQGVLPDGTELGYNLIRKTTVKGKDYIFKSNSQQEFSKEDIERAQLILNKIS